MTAGAKRILPYIIFCLLGSYLIINQYQIFADDPGVGWHLKTGEYISSFGKIPTTDPFLSSKIPRPWISDQWLADFVTYRIFEAGSWNAVYKVYSIIFILMFSWYIFSALMKSGSSVFSSVFALIVTLRLTLIHFILRPVLAGICIFGYVYFYIYESADRKIRIKDFAVLPLIFVLWANIHPSFVLGLFVILVSVLVCPSKPERTLLFALCCSVTLINPYFYRLHFSIFELFQSSYFMSLNQEWKPVDLLSVEFSFVAIIAAVYLFCIYAGRNKLISWFELSLQAVFFILIFRSVRFIPFFALCSIRPLAASLDFIANRYWRKKAEHPIVNKRQILLINLVAVLLIFFWPVKNAGPSSSLYPYECITLLNELNTDNRITTVLAHPNLGGFITFLSRSVDSQNLLRPVLDDRNTMLGEEEYRRFFDSLKDIEKLQKYILEAEPDYILLEQNSNFSRLISERLKYPEILCSQNWFIFRVP